MCWWLELKVGAFNGSPAASVPEGDVGNDDGRSTERSPRSWCGCESSGVARSGGRVELTVGEGRSWAERRAIRSGCIPAGN